MCYTSLAFAIITMSTTSLLEFKGLVEKSPDFVPVETPKSSKLTGEITTFLYKGHQYVSFGTRRIKDKPPLFDLEVFTDSVPMSPAFGRVHFTQDIEKVLRERHEFILRDIAKSKELAPGFIFAKRAGGTGTYVFVSRVVPDDVAEKIKALLCE